MQTDEPTTTKKRGTKKLLCSFGAAVAVSAVIANDIGFRVSEWMTYIYVCVCVYEKCVPAGWRIAQYLVHIYIEKCKETHSYTFRAASAAHFIYHLVTVVFTVHSITHKQTMNAT